MKRLLKRALFCAIVSPFALLSATALAQEPPISSPSAGSPSAGSPSAGSPSAGSPSAVVVVQSPAPVYSPPPAPLPLEPEERDRTRVRGGFSVNGGVMAIPDVSLSGPVFGLSGRIGVQINHYGSIFYQHTFAIGIFSGPNAVAAGVVDYNSIIGNVTLGHMFEIGAGPSLDFVGIGAAAVDSNGRTQSAAAGGTFFGAHGRLALNIGSLAGGKGPRRRGLALNLDAHPVFLSGATLLTVTGGIGAEWY